MPDPTGDQLSLLGRELDDHPPRVRRIANVHSERAVEHFLDLKVRGVISDN